MIVEEVVEGYDKFKQFVSELPPDAKVIFLFGGSKLPSGESWCSDCVRAEPVLQEILNSNEALYRLVHVYVGDRPYWKNMDCPFRKDPNLKLMVLPTYIKWNSVQKLEGDHCNNKDLVELLFSNEDE